MFSSNVIGNGGASGPTGQQEWTTPGTYQWTCPPGVFFVSAVAIGSGSMYAEVEGYGTAGGGLGWKNNIPVVPGQVYTVVVGNIASNVYGFTYAHKLSNGGESYFSDRSIVCGYGGMGCLGAGGFTGDGGGYGGVAGGYDSSSGTIGYGGGGAGGYSGNGGNGSPSNTNGTAGNGGAGGGGGGHYTRTTASTTYTYASGGGGGTGIYGQGASGAGGVASPDVFTIATGGGGGSGGQKSPTADYMNYGGVGGLYGGGGGAGYIQYNRSTGETDFGANARPGTGAVRIIWGPNRAFPSTNTGDM